MAVKNHFIKSFRVSKEMFALIQEATQQLGFKQTDLIRFLLNRSLMQLKADSIQAKGYDKLSFTLKETKRNF